MRVPSMAEREAAAIELGVIKPGEVLTPRLQIKLAKVLEKRDELAAQQSAEQTATSNFVGPITATYTELVESGLPETAAAQVVAAIAPSIWRANQGAAHAPNR